jgi:glycosyltransferase involved in cell wall biosynthesis
MPALTPTVSVVVPCYNEEGTLRELHERVRAEFVRLDMAAEIIFVDDGSTDTSRDILRALAEADPDCRVIFFRRNSGKAAALQTGFQAARGEYLITMDADLQDDPAEIPRFLEALQRYDVVSGWKVTRHDPIGKTLPSKLFNATVRKVTKVNLHDMNCGFKGYRRQVVQEVTLYGEMHRFVPALAAARGFRIGELGVTHHARKSGVSKYGWERFIRGFMDLLTVAYIMRYRFRPSHLFGGLGVGFMLVGLIFGAALSPFLTISTLHPPAWHFFMWLLVTVCLIIGPVFMGLGVIAEALLAATVHQLPPPPVSERLNFTAPDEVDHVNA